MLQVQAAKRQGEFSLDVSLAVADRSVLVLVGESGAGKTTLLRLLAGLQHPDGGRIVLDGTVLFDGDGGRALPARERPIGYVSQDYALFPHLSVRENVAFGLRAGGMGSQECHPRVHVALDRLGIAELAHRQPHQLSGGQQQRVALARAIVLEPRLLLLDEPLASLDLQARRSIRGELRRVLAELGCITVYVTHSPTEAMALGEQIAVLEGGLISQMGTREDLLRHPRSPYIAEFLGLNLFRGTIVRREPGASARVRVSQGELAVVDPGFEGDVLLLVDPRDIILSLEPPTGSARNVLEGEIEELAPEPPAGDHVRVFLASDPPLAVEVTQQSADSLGLRPGQKVFAAFKATGVTVLR